MCFAKAAKPDPLPPKPLVPTPQQSNVKAQTTRRVRLAGRRGTAENIRTSAAGAINFGENSNQRVLLGVG